MEIHTCPRYLLPCLCSVSLGLTKSLKSQTYLYTINIFFLNMYVRKFVWLKIHFVFCNCDHQINVPTDLNVSVRLADSAHEGATGHGLLVEGDRHAVRFARHRHKRHVVQTPRYRYNLHYKYMK